MNKNDLGVCLLNDSFPPVIDGVANTVLNYANIINEKYGHPIVSSLLLFWLLGTMHGWEWTYERNIFLTTA